MTETTRDVFISRYDFESIASVANACKPDDVIGAISAVKLTVEGNRWTAIATDRHIVAEVSAETGVCDAGSSEIHIEGQHLLDAAKIVARKIGRADARKRAQVLLSFTEVDGRPKLAVSLPHTDEVVANFTNVAGNFPPVERLFPEETSAVSSVALRTDLLAKLHKVRTPGEMHKTPKDWKLVPEVLQTCGADGTDRSPLLVTRFAQDEGETFRALIQPNRKA